MIEIFNKILCLIIVVFYSKNMLQIKNYSIVLNKMHKRINFLSKAKSNVSIKKIEFLIKNIWIF